MKKIIFVSLIFFVLGCQNKIDSRKEYYFTRSINLFDGFEKHFYWPINIKSKKSLGSLTPNSIGQALNELQALLDKSFIQILKTTSTISECNSNNVSKGELYEKYFFNVFDEMAKSYPQETIQKEFKENDISKIILDDIFIYIDLLQGWIINNFKLNEKNKLTNELNSIGIYDSSEMFYYLLLQIGGCKYIQDINTPELFIWDSK